MTSGVLHPPFRSYLPDQKRSMFSMLYEWCAYLCYIQLLSFWTGFWQLEEICSQIWWVQEWTATCWGGLLSDPLKPLIRTLICRFTSLMTAKQTQGRPRIETSGILDEKEVIFLENWMLLFANSNFRHDWDSAPLLWLPITWLAHQTMQSSDSPELDLCQEGQRTQLLWVLSTQVEYLFWSYDVLHLS